MRDSSPSSACVRLLTWLGLALAVAGTSGCGLSALVAVTAIVASDSKSSSSNGVPAPTVTSVFPADASHGGGQAITVVGTNFPADATVSVGGVQATGVAITTSGALTATVPFSSTVGPVDLVVTNPIGGSGTLTNGFTYTNTPTQAAIANLSGDLSQNVVLTVTLTDVESDPTDLTLEVDAGSGFQAIPPSQILSGSLNGLVSSPAGFDQIITWDSRATFPNQNVTDAVLRVTPTDTSDGQPGPAATSSLFNIVNNTPVQIALTQPGDDAFNVALEYRVTDADVGDPVQLTGLTYQDLSRGLSGNLSVASGQNLGSVPFSPTGVTSTTVWSSLANLGTGNNRLVTVTVTVSDGNSTASATSAPFFVSNGPLEDQTIFDAFIDVHGASAGDVVGNASGNADGLADLVAADTAIDGPFGAEDTTTGGTVAIIKNRGVRGRSGFESARVIRTLQDFNLQVGNTDGLPTPIGGLTQPPNLAAPAGPVAPFPNYFLGRILHPSESAIINADNDARQELLLAHSPHGVDADIDLLNYASVVLSNAGQDLAVSGGGHLRDHQLLLQIEHDAAGDLNFNDAAITRRLSQAPRSASSVAPIHTAGGNGIAFDPGNAIPFIGYFVQDLLAAELDGAGGGGDDLLILHGIADIEDAVNTDRRGAVTVLKRSATALITSMAYLDPTAMGVIPTHMAVADITSAAHDGVVNGDGGIPFPVAPNTAVAAGLPDILIANSGDNSLTFYVQTAAAGDANTRLPTYHGVRLPLNNLFLALGGAAPPNGDTRGVAIGDLNGDGANDFVVVGQLSRRLLVFIHDPLSGGPLSLNSNQSAGGNTEGGPYPQSQFPAGVLPFRLAQVITLPNVLGGRPLIDDLNGDGLRDIAVPMGSNNEVSVYVNSGTAAARAGFGESRPTPLFGVGFNNAATDPIPASASPTNFTSEFVPFEAFAFDFDRDRRTDLAVASGLSFDFSVFYQGAAGTLDRFVPVPTAGSPFLLDRGDLNGDGVPELAATVPSNNSVVIFSRNPTTTLSATATYTISGANNAPPNVVSPSLPFFVELGDATGDMIPDILVTSQLVVQGKSAQSTNDAQPRDQVGGWVLYPGVANALPNATTAVVRTSTFAPSGFAASAGDFLGNDGLPDVALSLVSSNGVNLYRGQGGNAFAGSTATSAGTAQIVSVSNGSSQGVDVIDLNGDSYPDVLVCTADATRGLEVYWGDPTGAVPPNAPAGTDFTTYKLATSGIGPAVALLVVDVGGPLNPFNGQPMLDVIVSGFTAQAGGILFQLHPGSGNPRLPGFVPPSFQQVPLLVGGEPGQIAVGDLDGNGSPDIALPWGKDNVLAVYYRDPAVNPLNVGTLSTLFQGPALFETSNTPIGCAVYDVDGDARNDVVVASRGASSLNVFLQR